MKFHESARAIVEPMVMEMETANAIRRKGNNRRKRMAHPYRQTLPGASGLAAKGRQHTPPGSSRPAGDSFVSAAWQIPAFLRPVSVLWTVVKGEGLRPAGML